MTRNWVAILSALLVAGVCNAKDEKVKDKDKTAPTNFATVGCTTPPVATPCPETCCSSCNQGGACHGKVKDWLCFIPLRTCPCECKGPVSCQPPLYVYFLRPCVEAQPCWHYDDHCSSCVRNSCASRSCASRRA